MNSWDILLRIHKILSFGIFSIYKDYTYEVSPNLKVNELALSVLDILHQITYVSPFTSWQMVMPHLPWSK